MSCRSSMAGEHGVGRGCCYRVERGERSRTKGVWFWAETLSHWVFVVVQLLGEERVGLLYWGSSHIKWKRSWKVGAPSCSGEADSLRVMGSWETEHEKHSRWLFLRHLLGTAYLAGPPRPVLSSSLSRWGFPISNSFSRHDQSRLFRMQM